MKLDKFRVFFDYDIGFYTPDFWDMKKVFKTYTMGDDMPHLPLGKSVPQSNCAYLFIRLWDTSGVHSAFFKVDDIYGSLSFLSKNWVGKVYSRGNK